MIRRILSIFRRKPKAPPVPAVPWLYLGWSEIKYTDDKGDATKTQTVHFYARGPELAERKFEYEDKGKFDVWRYHRWMQQRAIPWEHGENLWSPIYNPSEAFKDWTRERSRHEWRGDRWYLPAKKMEGNLVEFPTKKKEQ